MVEGREWRLRVGGECLRWTAPVVMGVLNVTPDSFYGACSTFDVAMRAAEEMVAAGVDIIDVGGEATNPAVSLSDNGERKADLEVGRVVPVIEAICARFPVLVSVDTSQPLVMREAVGAGAKIINDQRALSVPGALAAAVDCDCPVVLMHGFLDERDLRSGDGCIVARVKSDLGGYIERAVSAGLGRDQLIIDPGFGQGHYGKTLDENYRLLSALPELVDMGFPILVGWSRKSMIGDVVGVAVADRLPGSLAAAAVAGFLGANIVRVHDVAATKQALGVANRLRCNVI